MTIQDDVASWIPVAVGVGVASNLMRNLPGSRPRYRRARRKKKR